MHIGPYNYLYYKHYVVVVLSNTYTKNKDV